MWILSLLTKYVKKHESNLRTILLLYDNMAYYLHSLWTHFVFTRELV